MKRKFLTLAFLALGTTAFVSCSDDDDETVINAQELPENAQTFVSTHFPAADYTKIEKKQAAESDGTLYEVELSNNFEIDFTAEGEWVDIDGNNSEVPVEIIPENIAGYVTENYTDLFITGIDKEPTGYEINLSNDLDVYFDQDENFVREEQ